MKKIIITGLLTICMSTGLRAGEEGAIPVVKLPTTRTPPVINGILDDKAFQKAEPLSGFTYGFENWAAPADTAVRMCRDQDAFYIAFDCAEPDPENIKISSTNKMEIWGTPNDAAVIFLVPDENELHAGVPAHYQFAASVGGIIFDQYRGPEENLNYNYEDLCDVAIKTGKTNWTAEIKLPFDALRLAPQMGAVWRFNLCRVRAHDRHRHTSWADDGGMWKDVTTYGYLRGVVIGERGDGTLSLDEAVLPETPAVGTNMMTLKMRSTHDIPGANVQVTTLAPSGTGSEQKVMLDIKSGLNEYPLPYLITPEPGNHKVEFTVDTDAKTIYQSPPAKVAMPDLISAFNDRNYYTTEDICRINVMIPEIFQEILDGKHLYLTLATADNKIVSETKLETLDRHNTATMDIKDLAPGTYTASVILISETGQHMARKAMEILKLPPAGNEVKTDHEREIFLVNNKQFFPIGWFFDPADVEAGLKEVSEHGFNHVLTFSHHMDLPELIHFLDTAHKYGVKVSVVWESVQKKYIFIGFHYHVQAALKGYGKTKSELFDEILEDFEATLPHIKDHPALFAYQLIDEPGDSSVERNAQKRIIEAARRLDPHRPCWTSFSRIIRQLPVEQNNEMYDFPGVHLYWNAFFPDSIMYIVWWTEMAQKVANSLHMPLLLSVQGGMPSVARREPTAGELRMNAYIGLTYGLSGGYNYFMYDQYMYGVPVHGKSWAEMKTLNEEFQQLASVLARPVPKQDVIIESQQMRALIRGAENKLYLIVVNLSGNSQDVEFHLNFLSKNAKIKNFFTGKTLSASGSMFTDRLRYQNSMVYEFSGANAPENGKLRLEIKSKALDEQVDNTAYFTQNSGAYLLAGQKAICIYGHGNTLASVAEAIDNPALFSYNPDTRTAEIGDVKLRIAYGGELVIGDKSDPSKGETVRIISTERDSGTVLCNGSLKVYNSRLIGNQKQYVRLMNIGRVVIEKSVVENFLHYFVKEIGEAEPDGEGRITVTAYGPFVLPENAWHNELLQSWSDD